MFAEVLDESARDPERVPSASVIPLVTNIDVIREFMTVRTRKMSKCIDVNIQDMLKAIGEEELQSFLSDFSSR